MEEEKVLLKITLDGDVSSTSFHCEGTNELAAVALSINALIKKTPDLADMLLCAHMAEEMGYNTEPIESPDFDRILKESSHGN